MNPDRSNSAMKLLGRLVPERRPSEAQRVVFCDALEGDSYAEIACRHDYDHDYVRRVGSELWRELSTQLGIRVTKKNLAEVVGVLVPDQRLSASVPPPYPGGPIAPGSPFYLPPPGLEPALAEIEKPGGLVRIKAPAKYGKTSAVLQILEHARQLGMATVLVDLARIEHQGLVDIDRFLRWLAQTVTTVAGLPSRIDEYWSDQVGCKVGFAHYLEDHILASEDSPLLLALDGVERLLEHPLLASEFLPLVRSCFEEARYRPEMARLRWILAYSTEVYVPIDLRHSPFNVGYPVPLADFTVEEVQQLAGSYGLDWDPGLGRSQATRLAEAVGGHPYLVQTALFGLTRERDGGHEPVRGLGHLLELADHPGGIFADHLQRLLATLENSPGLGTVLGSVLRGTTRGHDPVAVYKLEALGLVRVTASGVQVRCATYDRFFASRLG
ncbi:MAG: hypothetical protein GY856_37500 [bacterium]|nr:hypothetical protein [bacterium]